MTTLTVAEVLDRAADLIAPEGAWTQGAVARNSFGALTFADDRDAVCWSCLGAIWRASGECQYDRFEAESAALGSIPGESIGLWNDAPERTQAEVVAALREAAVKAREQGK